MKLSIVDVFAEARYQGNQLAVVEDAADLSTEAMQAIALEMNFSETTFVTARAESGGTVRAEVRIFTPGRELPFAGHPTLGTAWVLTGGRAPVTLALGAGDVPVRFVDGVAWLTPPPAALGERLTPEAAAALIGLSAADLDPALDAQVVECGPRFVIIGVASLDALRRLRVAADGPEEYGWPFVVCRGGYSADADFAARMLFFDGAQMREDPATGSANACFANYLAARDLGGSFVVEQGFEIRRPSRIRLTVGRQIAVGGRVQDVARGELLD